MDTTEQQCAESIKDKVARFSGDIDKILQRIADIRSAMNLKTTPPNEATVYEPEVVIHPADLQVVIRSRVSNFYLGRFLADKTRCKDPENWTRILNGIQKIGMLDCRGLSNVGLTIRDSAPRYGNAKDSLYASLPATLASVESRCQRLSQWLSDAVSSYPRPSVDSPVFFPIELGIEMISGIVSPIWEQLVSDKLVVPPD